ncbi:Accessory secretory protein Asp3 [Streptococcus oralis]|nr:Accessory secretory protein Asp3 [Streptococcus oralis]
MKMQVQPANGLYLKLTFLNRYEEIIEEKIERQFSFTFTYPETAYTYRLSLISAGFEALDFVSFSIEEDAGV